MKTPAILSSHQFACILQKRWNNGIKSRGRGGIDTRNAFGHNFIQLTRVWKMERLKMRAKTQGGYKVYKGKRPQPSASSNPPDPH
eukprot:739533-Pelagomonas_calceolata.AAC.1